MNEALRLRPKGGRVGQWGITGWLQYGFVFSLAMTVWSCSPEASGPAISKVPDFTLSSLRDGGAVTLSKENKEAPVLLVFWASWCPSCVEEIPDVNRILKKYSAQGLKVFAVNVQESRETILNFQKRHPMDYPVLLDKTGGVAEKFGLVGLPAAVLAQQGGNVLYFGFSLPANLEKLLQTEEKQKA